MNCSMTSRPKLTAETIHELGRASVSLDAFSCCLLRSAIGPVFRRLEFAQRDVTNVAHAEIL